MNKARQLVFLSLLVLAPVARSLTLSLGTWWPVPGTCDINSFAGANMDMNNVYAAGNAPATNGSANDSYTYVANDRPTQGQTFTTGTSPGGYLLTDVWVRHAGYIDNTTDPNTPGSNGTFYQMAGGGALTLRITNPSQAGTAGFVLHSETYSTTGLEGWPSSAVGTLNGDGRWLHFTLAEPVLLSANTAYGFDLSSVTNNNCFFEWLGDSTNTLAGGTAYNGSAPGVPDNTENPLVGSRVFLLQLTPQAHPTLVSNQIPGNQILLSWSTNYAGYLLQTSTNLNGPWTYSAQNVSTLDGTNSVEDSISNHSEFYRLQYLTGPRPVPVLSWQTNTTGLIFQMSTGVLQLQVFSSQVIRVTYGLTDALPTNSFAVLAAPTNSGWTVTQAADSISLSTPSLTVSVNRATGAVGFYDTNGSVILTELPQGGRSLVPITVSSPSSDGGINTLQSQQQFLISPNEAFYGLGEDAAGLMNYRGATVHLQNQNPSECGLPVLVSSRGYGIFWDNPAISDVNVGEASSTNLTWSSDASTSVDYYFMYGPALDNVIASYRCLTGNPPMFGKWAWGLWQCRNHYLTQDEVLGVAATYRADNIPLDCVIQDWQYWTPNPWGSHLFDTNRYPNVAQMMRTLHGENTHLIISVWARFDTNILNANMLSAVNGLYTNILANVYPAGFGQWYDPFNAAARQVYWNEIATNLFNLGIDGWWLDASEPELSGNWGEFANYNTAAGPGAQVFNAYPLMHTTSVYQGQRAISSTNRVFILTRSAWAGQQRNAAVTWSGDINGDFPSLARQVALGLNFSISGVPYWNTDTGGFNDNAPGDPAYDELFTRWFQFSAFCPMLRIHGNNNKAIYLFPTSTETNLINFDELRYHLIPYIYSVAWMVTSRGYTMMRPLVMDFQLDSNVFNIPDQYMFGPSLMACPVTLAGATNRNVYLPAGTIWYDFWTGQTNAGGQTISANATIDTMPIQVPAGSIIPYGPPIQYATEDHDPIELRVYPGANGSFTLYDDEGDNYNYESGTYATIPLSWNDRTRTLTIGARQGSYPGMLNARTFHVVWVSANHGTGFDQASVPDATVIYNGSTVQVSSGN
ncbi:MAG TPA: TIM-barrel domain-containing protein [Verrucomicrobiae bacterium]|nr:TIM-barrel domain-containing protein [Verrucomicrobiae bacterium]